MQILSVVIVGLSLLGTAQAEFSKEQKAEIKKLFQEAISEKPELVATALDSHMEEQNKRRQAELARKITESKRDLLNKTTATVVGADSNTRQLIVFYDNNCPHCRVLDKHLTEFRQKNRDVTIYYRQFPIMGKDSQEAAAGMIALGNMSKFEPVADLIAKSKEPLTKDGLFKFARENGVSADRLGKDMASQVVKDALSANMDLGKKLDLQGTPVVIASDDKGIRMLDGKDLQAYLGMGA